MPLLSASAPVDSCQARVLLLESLLTLDDLHLDGALLEHFPDVLFDPRILKRSFYFIWPLFGGLFSFSLIKPRALVLGYKSKLRCYGVSHNDSSHKDISHNDTTHKVTSHNATLVIKDICHNDITHNT